MRLASYCYSTTLLVSTEGLEPPPGGLQPPALPLTPSRLFTASPMRTVSSLCPCQNGLASPVLMLIQTNRSFEGSESLSSGRRFFLLIILCSSSMPREGIEPPLTLGFNQVLYL